MTKMFLERSVVGMHLDLKYQMPNQTYLLEWVGRLADAGINTLLLEYEDKFPFRKYPFLRQPGAFAPDELRRFLDRAREAGLRVVPLVQTLSHLEFALNHDRLAGLRELPEVPTQICPSNPAAVEFVHDLLDEVLAFHGEDEWVHLGADESWFLGQCPQCAEQCPNGNKTVLWARHTSGMCEYVRARGKRPLVWDDTLWHSPETVQELPGDTVLCSWHYATTRYQSDGKLARLMDAYRTAGRDALCVPCGNWGVLFPRHETFDNMAALAQCAREKTCLGVINSAWSVFHLPLPVFWLQVLATQPICATGQGVSPEWEQRALDDEFGVHIDGLADALAALGRLWEVGIEGLQRPIIPMMHGYMDMVLHYPGGQHERMQRGAYPLDWAGVDFVALYRRKIDLLKALPATAPFWQDLDRYLADYDRAAPLLGRLAAQSCRHQSEARLFGALAGFKRAATRALAFHIRGTPDRGTARAEIEATREPLEGTLRPFYEPETVRRLMRAWHEPVATALR